MQHTPVSSSNLASVGYDPDTQTLEVTFKDGSTYAYAGVPASAYDGLMASDSLGSYLHRHIKSRYAVTKL